ncbi:MAG: fused endonuclease-methyltransferase [Ignavibacteria bacterium]|nr:fused endonuclease-methyltransferase [Ignavibacteria bacterium]
MITLTKSQAKKEITFLVNDFEKNIDYYKDKNYKEAQVENDFIRPLFQILNWNVSNRGLEPEKQVFQLQVTGKTGSEKNKRPDYLLRIPVQNTNSMKSAFFIEAKKPIYDLKTNETYIRQVYQYAYSTLNSSDSPNNHVRLALLTDFEEFRFFDCSDVTPLKQNLAEAFNKHIIKDWTYKDYILKFDELWDLFEYNNVVNGSLDKWHLTAKQLADNRITPDKQFLEDLKQWRLDIARSMFKNDKTLDDFKLTKATLLYINRLIFVKMLADRNIEEDYLTNILNKLSQSKKTELKLYELCKDIFLRLDHIYNGSMFEYESITDEINIDNSVLKNIFTALKPENSIYTLAAMPVEIIGNVYELFIAEQIVKKGSAISIVPKYDEKKAGGVYYTPRYIVEYIVDNTLGIKLGECKTPDDVTKIKVLDPACGSGSFLIVAYQKLLDWHKKYYYDELKKWEGNNGACSIVQNDEKQFSTTNNGACSIVLSAYHITWVTYNSRISERMKNYENIIKFQRLNKGMNTYLPPRILNIDEEIKITKIISDIINEDKLRITAYNICEDHIHLVLVCKENERNTIVQKLKAVSARKLNIELGITSVQEQTREHAPLFKNGERGNTQNHLWAQKYHCNTINSDDEMYNIMNYIFNNRIKHELTENKELESIIQNMIISVEEAFNTTNNGACSIVQNDKSQFSTSNNGACSIVQKNQKNNFRIMHNSDFYSIHLSHKLKSEILTNNIFGVDIDDQAVLVTKFSLSMKAMEDSTHDEVIEDNTIFRTPAIPKLENNIKCGNSLIGSDFYLDNRPSLFNEKEKRKINTFDWEKEFPEIFKTTKKNKENSLIKKIDNHLNAAVNYIEGAVYHTVKANEYVSDLVKNKVREETIEYNAGNSGGFDVIVGNPPYVKYENLNIDTIDYLKNKYETANSFFDIYQLFIEKSITMLKTNGYHGFIIPNLFLKGMNYKFSRKFYLDNTVIKSIANYGDGVFYNVKIPTCILISTKNKEDNYYLEFLEKKADFIKGIIKISNFYNDNYSFTQTDLKFKLNDNTVNLENLVKITRGLEIGKDQRINSKTNFVEILFGDNISRYLIKSISKIDKAIYKEFQKDIEIFKQSKIIIRETGSNITATYDDSGLITNRSIYCIRLLNLNYSLLYILSILNSKFIQYYYSNNYKAETEIFPKIRIGQVKQLPIRSIDFSNRAEKQMHDKLVELVEQMLENQKYLHDATNDSDKKMYKNICDSIDGQIDRLVYKLYDLTEEEIGIVEK